MNWSSLSTNVFRPSVGTDEPWYWSSYAILLPNASNADFDGDEALPPAPWDFIENTPNPLNQQIKQGGILPAIKKAPFNIECYITTENITSSYLQCTNPTIQHCCDAETYVSYVRTLSLSENPKCPACRCEMDPQVYCISK